MVRPPLSLGPVDVTPDEFRRLCFYSLFRRQMPRVFTRVVPVLFLLVLLPDWLRGRLTWNFALSVVLVWPFFTFLFMIAIQLWQIRKARTQLGDFLLELRWELSEEGLTIHNQRSTTRYKWNELRDPLCSSTTAYVHLVSRPSVALYLPLRALPAGVGGDELLALLKEKT